jgi:hypothetical protein
MPVSGLACVGLGRQSPLLPKLFFFNAGRTQVKDRIQRFLRSHSGVTAIEYAPPGILNPVLPATSITASLRHHRLLLLIVALHFCLALYIQHQLPAQLSQPFSMFAPLFFGLLFALCGYTIFVMVVRRPEHLVQTLRADLSAYLTAQRLAYALPVILLVPVFAYSFALVKAAIPLLHPFELDIPLAALDAKLHGGIHPWAWLQPLLGYPPVTAVINFIYHLWFFLLLASIYWVALAVERKQLRMQYLLSFVLTWIVLGNFAALWLSSAGPCYFGRVSHGHDPYAPLMHYLRAANESVPVWALNVQEILWRSYDGKAGSVPLGISAMPSIHVASSVQMAMLGWRVHRSLGIAMSIFAGLIMLGSVHLGWHYAIDGYLAALGAWLIWKLVEWLPACSTAAAGERS